MATVREGFSAGAHSEANRGVGRRGDGRWAANRRRGSPGTEVEEDVGDGVGVLPRLLGSAWMKKTTRRSSRSHRQGEGWLVPTGTAIGVGELARSSSCSCGREGKVGESERVVHGACVASSWGPEGGGKQEVAGARACVRWPRASHPPGGRLRVTGVGQWTRPLQCQIR